MTHDIEAEGAFAPRVDVTHRQCGGCTACCTVMRVSCLDKPAGRQCGHALEAGCSIYETRPRVCREFTCLWLADRFGILRDEHRPDRIGIVLTNASAESSDSHAIAAMELHSGAASSVAGQALIGRLRQFVAVQIVPLRTGAPLQQISILGRNVQPQRRAA